MAGPIHPIQDTDARFSIDPITRAIKNETLKKLYLVINDKNSEVFTFELPRYGVEGHDMAACNKVEVHYVNTNSTTKEKSASPYKVTDYGVDPDDPEKMTFSWTITEKATKHPGSLAFAIHFACVDDVTEEVHYWWSTATNTTITVLDCVDLTADDGEESTDLQEKTATPSTEIQVLRPDGDFRGLSKVLINPIPEEFIAPTGTLFVDANGNYSVREYDQVLVRVPNVPPVLQEKEITANGTHTPDTGYEGFSQVTVNVADAPALQEKTAYPSTSEQTVEPDDGFAGLSKVTVGAMRLQSKSIDQNGEVIADSGYDGLSKVTIRVQPSLQDKTLTLSENGETEVIADSGYYGLDKVRVRVNVETDPVALQEKTVVANGTFTPDAGFDGFSKVYVEVASDAPSTEEATVTPTLDTQEVLPAAGKLLSKVTVRPIPAEYMKPEGTATLRANGEYDIAGKAKAVVDVPTGGGGGGTDAVLIEKTITENGTHSATDDSADGYSQVTVNVPIPDGYIQPSGTKNVTTNGTFNIKEFEKVSVNVPLGGGDCTREHVIPVDELPEAGVIGKVYKCNGEYYKYIDPQFIDVILCSEGTKLHFVKEYSKYGMAVTANTISTKTAESILESDPGASSIHFYYIEDEKDVFLFAEGEWASASLLFEGDFGGTVLDETEANVNGCYYALFDGGWTLHAPVDGSLLIEENGTYDVTNKKQVEVDLYIPEVSNSTLRIEGPEAGYSRSWNESKYYNSFSISSLPTQDIIAVPSSVETVYKADEGHVLKTVTVPAVDLSTNKILCGITIESFPKTEYQPGDWLMTDGGAFKIYYTNGETETIDLLPKHVSGFTAATEAGLGRHIVKVIYTEGDRTCTATFCITIGDLCTITIDGNKCGACDGMTWRNWVESNFNTLGYVIKDAYVCDSSGKYLMEDGPGPVTASSAISGGASYTLGT